MCVCVCVCVCVITYFLSRNMCSESGDLFSVTANVSAVTGDVILCLKVWCV